MSAASRWTELAERFGQSMAAVVAELEQCAPLLWNQIGHHSTAAFPLNAFVSLSKHGSQGDEDVVVNWQVARGSAGLESWVDISRGDGTILAETKRRRLTEPVDLDEAGRALNEAINFVTEHTGVIRREIC